MLNKIIAVFTIFTLATSIVRLPDLSPFGIWYDMTEEQRDNAPVELKADIANMTVSEFKFLSAVVEAESDRKKNSESFENRVLIAIVILNRVDSNKFPGTITKVLKQSGQFSVVRSGAYRRVGRTNLSDRAVIEAVRRKVQDGAPNILYFRSGHFFRGHRRYKKVGDNYFSY